MNSRIIISPRPVSQISSNQSKNSYFEKQIRYAADDQFSFADLKNFSPSDIFVKDEEEGKIFFTTNSNRPLFDLYILYFFANSQGKQKYLSKFKKLVFDKTITIPSNTNTDIIALQNDVYNFFPIMVAKLKHYQDSFDSIKDTIKFLHSYELFFHVAKIIFFNYLRQQENDINEQADLQQKQITNLDQYVDFDKEDIALIFDFTNKRLQVVQRKSKIQQKQVQEISIENVSQVVVKSSIQYEKLDNQPVIAQTGSLQIQFQQPKQNSSILKVQQAYTKEQNIKVQQSKQQSSKLTLMEPHSKQQQLQSQTKLQDSKQHHRQHQRQNNIYNIQIGKKLPEINSLKNIKEPSNKKKQKDSSFSNMFFGLFTCCIISQQI